MVGGGEGCSVDNVLKAGKGRILTHMLNSKSFHKLTEDIPTDKWNREHRCKHLVTSITLLTNDLFKEYGDRVMRTKIRHHIYGFIFDSVPLSDRLPRKSKQQQLSYYIDVSKEFYGVNADETHCKTVHQLLEGIRKELRETFSSLSPFVKRTKRWKEYVHTADISKNHREKIPTSGHRKRKVWTDDETTTAIEYFVKHGVDWVGCAKVSGLEDRSASDCSDKMIHLKSKFKLNRRASATDIKKSWVEHQKKHAPLLARPRARARASPASPASAPANHSDTFVYRTPINNSIIFGFIWNNNLTDNLQVNRTFG